jgi:hypothetical protein
VQVGGIDQLGRHATAVTPLDKPVTGVGTGWKCRHAARQADHGNGRVALLKYAISQLAFGVDTRSVDAAVLHDQAECVARSDGGHAARHTRDRYRRPSVALHAIAELPKTTGAPSESGPVLYRQARFVSYGDGGHATSERGDC